MVHGHVKFLFYLSLFPLSSSACCPLPHVLVFLYPSLLFSQRKNEPSTIKRLRRTRGFLFFFHTNQQFLVLVSHHYRRQIFSMVFIILDHIFQNVFVFFKINFYKFLQLQLLCKFASNFFGHSYKFDRIILEVWVLFLWKRNFKK